jgi:hypothetical protein
MQRMLKKLVIAYAVVALAVALLLLSAGAFLPLALYLAVNVVVVAGAILVARGRKGLHFAWEQERMEPTGESFTDPTTGEKIQVMVDPKTGLRNVSSLGPLDVRRGPKRQP